MFTHAHRYKAHSHRFAFEVILKVHMCLHANMHPGRYTHTMCIHEGRGIYYTGKHQQSHMTYYV